MASSYSQKNNRAFSLLELVIAIAILSIGITAILRALAFSAQVTGLSCDLINASFLVEDKMQELDFKEKQQLIAHELAETDGTSDKFAYVYKLEPPAALSLYKLDFQISWLRAKRKEQFGLVSYLHP